LENPFGIPTFPRLRQQEIFLLQTGPSQPLIRTGATFSARGLSSLFPEENVDDLSVLPPQQRSGLPFLRKTGRDLPGAETPVQELGREAV
jgi:hypothetical protein